jgi:hypothetical protein
MSQLCSLMLITCSSCMTNMHFFLLLLLLLLLFFICGVCLLLLLLLQVIHVDMYDEAAKVPPLMVNYHRDLAKATTGRMIGGGSTAPRCLQHAMVCVWHRFIPAALDPSVLLSAAVPPTSWVQAGGYGRAWHTV